MIIFLRLNICGIWFITILDGLSARFKYSNMLKKTHAVIKPYIKKTLDAIYPPQCIACHAPVGVAGNLCASCWNDVNFIANPLCSCCGTPFELSAYGGAVCGECIAHPPLYKMARAVFCYDDASRRLITSFKYSDRIYTSDAFAKWMLRAGEEIMQDADFIISVPMHRLRLITRRYNQAALLANSMAKQSSLPVYHKILLRKKYTKPQASLTFKQRKLNVKGAFIINPKYMDRIINKNIIIVDDVMTTGATIDACIRPLLKAGAASVNVLTIAKTVKG